MSSAVIVDSTQSFYVKASPNPACQAASSYLAGFRPHSADSSFLGWSWGRKEQEGPRRLSVTGRGEIDLSGAVFDSSLRSLRFRSI